MTAAPVARASVVQELLDTVSTAHVLQAAAELGMIDCLLRAQLDATELAHACSTDPPMTALLLDALAELGVVARLGANGRYGLSNDAVPLVAAVAHGWAKLADVVRSGEPLVRAHEPDGAAVLYPDVVPLLSALFAPMARRAAQLLTGRCVNVLDVGAGAAPWSIALAASSPDMRVTALDVPSVIAATRPAVEAAGLADRFGYLPADMFTCALPRAAYDLVLLANVCHLHDEAANRALLRRLRPAISPGGMLAIVDVLAATDRQPRRSLSLYALGLRLRTSRGTVHPLTAYEAWTSASGFGPLHVERLSAEPPLFLMVCGNHAKPGSAGG